MRHYNEYEQQARAFMSKAGAKMSICRVEIVDRFPNDDSDTGRGNRWKYRVTIRRAGKSYSFNFYDSIRAFLDGDRPRVYDILASVEKYEPCGDAWDFADEYGYTIDSREAYNRVERIRRACEKQYKRLLDIFGAALMDDLREIN